MNGLTEDRKFPRKKYAPLVTVRSLSADTPNPVKILCIVVEAQQGAAYVQDIFDKAGEQASIQVTVDGTLEVAQKYMLIGDVKEERGSDRKLLRLITSSAYNVDSLDIGLFKETIELESKM